MEQNVFSSLKPDRRRSRTVPQQQHGPVPPGSPQHPGHPGGLHRGRLHRDPSQRCHPVPALLQGAHRVLGHPVQQPGRLRPAAAAVAVLQGALPPGGQPLGAGRGRLPPRHRLFLRQPVRLGPHAGLHQHQALPGRGAPLHVQGAAQAGVHGLGRAGGVGRVRRRHAAYAAGAAELPAAAAADHHLPRRAASGGRHHAQVPALLRHGPGRVRAARAAAGHHLLQRLHRPRAEAVAARLVGVHPQQPGAAGRLPGVLHARHRAAPGAPRAAPPGLLRQPLHLLQGRRVSVLPARLHRPLPLPPHVQVLQLQAPVPTRQWEELQRLALKHA